MTSWWNSITQRNKGKSKHEDLRTQNAGAQCKTVKVKLVTTLLTHLEFLVAQRFLHDATGRMAQKAIGHNGYQS